jgi:hypothetical protein
MGNRKMVIAWKADQIILNSVFELPPDRTIISYPPLEANYKSRIAPRSKMSLMNGDLTLIFDDNKVCFREPDRWGIYVQAVVYYLAYRTFLNYNCLMFEEESPQNTPEADEVVFKLYRYVTKHVERNGEKIPYMDTEPCEIVLNKKDIENYLKILDQTVWYAICYYLLGCQTQRYFLVEFYKCLEVIKNHFVKEKKMTEVLKPHGFLEDVYKQVKKLANDRMKPLSIARHAPPKGIPVQNIDTKWFFNDPMGRKVFDAGEKACRNIVEAYIKFRNTEN